jgi:Ca-activated chloride channel family protein
MRKKALLASLLVTTGHASTAEPAHHGGRSGSISLIPTAGLKAEAFKTDDGKSGWRVRIPGGRALATPAVVGGTVFVGGGFGSHEFYAFDAQTGQPRWAARVSDDGPTAAVVTDDRVVFNTESCTLFVADARTGKQVWSRWLGDPLMSQPAVADGVVYMAYPGQGGHRLIALALDDGKQLFDTPIAGDIISAPVVQGDSVYLTTFDGTVYRHDRRSGKLLWQKKLGATSAPWVAADGQIHVAQGQVAQGGAHGRGKQEGFRSLAPNGAPEGDLKASRPAPHLEASRQRASKYSHDSALDDASVGFGGGAPATAKAAEAADNIGQSSVRGLWEYQGSRPTVVGDNNYMAQGDVVRRLDTKSGKVLWEDKLAGDAEKIGGHLGSPPAFAAGKLVIGTATGALLGYDAASGKKLFRYQVGQQIRFQPALVKGRIFAGTAEGTLVSVNTGDATLDGWTMWGGGPRHNGQEKTGR